jgi:hypothetical protein
MSDGDRKSELTDDHRQILLIVLNFFRENRPWPTYRWLLSEQAFDLGRIQTNPAKQASLQQCVQPWAVADPLARPYLWDRRQSRGTVLVSLSFSLSSPPPKPRGGPERLGEATGQMGLDRADLAHAQDEPAPCRAGTHGRPLRGLMLVAALELIAVLEKVLGRSPARHRATLHRLAGLS